MKLPYVTTKTFDYSDKEIEQIQLATQAITSYAADHGIAFLFSKKFFDSLDDDRGIGKLTPDILVNSCSKVLTRGLNFFREKPEFTEYVFTDSKTLLFMRVTNTGKNAYVVTHGTLAAFWQDKTTQVIRL